MARKKRSAQYEAPPPPKAVMETRVFKSGNSYAVRLPKPLYAGGEGSVVMRKLGNGTLLISPRNRRRWPVGFFESFGTLPDDFVAPRRPRPDAADEERTARLFDDE